MCNNEFSYSSKSPYPTKFDCNKPFVTQIIITLTFLVWNKYVWVSWKLKIKCINILIFKIYTLIRKCYAFKFKNHNASLCIVYTCYIISCINKKIVLHSLRVTLDFWGKIIHCQLGWQIRNNYKVFCLLLSL